MNSSLLLKWKKNSLQKRIPFIKDHSRTSLKKYSYNEFQSFTQVKVYLLYSVHSTYKGSSRRSQKRASHKGLLTLKAITVILLSCFASSVQINQYISNTTKRASFLCCCTLVFDKFAITYLYIIRLGNTHWPFFISL